MTHASIDFVGQNVFFATQNVTEHKADRRRKGKGAVKLVECAMTGAAKLLRLHVIPSS